MKTKTKYIREWFSKDSNVILTIEEKVNLKTDKIEFILDMFNNELKQYSVLASSELKDCLAFYDFMTK